MSNQVSELILDPEKYFTKIVLTVPYCDCDFPQKSQITNDNEQLSDIIKCRCLENIQRTLEWSWENQNPNYIRISGNYVNFHPVSSRGTATLRGNRSLEIGKVHFWEMQIITALTGTDVQFGVATERFYTLANTSRYWYSYTSPLGGDKESWGLSYTGHAKHDGIAKRISHSFSKGVVLGICLDRVNGTMEFHINRRSLGIIYTNIPLDKQTLLYPVITCTSAKTIVRLVNATSVAKTLAMQAFKTLSLDKDQMYGLFAVPGLRHFLERYWFLAPHYFSNRL